MPTLRRSTFVYALSLGATALAFPAISLADAPPPITIHPVIGFTGLSQAINTIVTAIMFFGAVAAFAFIVLGAFQYVTAGDSADGTKKARQTITNAVVGLIILSSVYVIFAIVRGIIPGLDEVFK